MFHFLRKDYGGPGAFAPNRPPVPMLDNLGEFARTLGRWWLWLPALAAWSCSCERIARPPATDRRDPRRVGAARGDAGDLRARCSCCGSTSSSRASGCSRPSLSLVAGADPRGPDRGRVQRRRRVARAARAEARRVADGLGARRVRRGARELAAVSSRRCTRRRSSRTCATCCASLPQNAVVVVAEDDLDFASSYVQLVLGERRDVTVIMWYAVARPATRERIEHDLGFAIPKVGNDIFVAHFADAVLASGPADVRRRLPEARARGVPDVSVRHLVSRAAEGQPAAVDPRGVRDQSRSLREVRVRLSDPDRRCAVARARPRSPRAARGRSSTTRSSSMAIPTTPRSRLELGRSLLR